MKVIHNSWFPFGSFSTINLFGIMFTKSQKLSERTLNHEAIHSAQMRELLWIPFYLLYVIEFIVKFAKIRDWHKAYRALSFEREAYANESNQKYLDNRKKFAWVDYLNAEKPIIKPTEKPTEKPTDAPKADFNNDYNEDYKV